MTNRPIGTGNQRRDRRERREVELAGIPGWSRFGMEDGVIDRRIPDRSRPQGVVEWIFEADQTEPLRRAAAPPGHNIIRRSAQPFPGKAAAVAVQKAGVSSGISPFTAGDRQGRQSGRVAWRVRIDVSAPAIAASSVWIRRKLVRNGNNHIGIFAATTSYCLSLRLLMAESASSLCRLLAGADRLAPNCQPERVRVRRRTG